MMSELFDEEVLRKQYDRAERRIAYNEGRNIGREEGIKEGINEGENLMAKLIEKLLSVGRSDDILKVSTDPDYRQLMYREFGLA